MTGFEWRDAKGRPCRLIVEVYNGESAGHVATEADLLTALGQLSTGRDGPTEGSADEGCARCGDTYELRANSEDSGYCDPCAHDEMRELRAGRALGEQKLKAQGWRHVPDTHEVIPKGRHEWVLKSDLDASESELAATKAKLAEVTDNHAVIVNERDLFARQSAHFEGQYLSATAKLAEVERERFELFGDVEAAQERQGRAEAELASARRVVEAVHRLKRATNDTKLPWREATTPFGKALIEVIDALASAGTDADRTEAPKCEQRAGCRASKHSYRCPEIPPVRDFLPNEPPRHEAGESGLVCQWRRETENDWGTPMVGPLACDKPATSVSCDGRSGSLHRRRTPC